MFVHLYRGSSTSEKVSGKKVLGVYLADVELLLQYVGLLPSTIMWRGMEPYTAPTGWSVGGGGVASTETSVVCIGSSSAKSARSATFK